MDAEETQGEQQQKEPRGAKEKESVSQDFANKSGIEESLEDIEAALAQLKKELGL